MDSRMLKELEEGHYQMLRQFGQDEEMMEDLNHQFSVRTGQLMDVVRQAFHGDATFERDSHLAQLQENLENYRHHCRRRLEELEEARYQENRRFQDMSEEN